MDKLRTYQWYRQGAAFTAAVATYPASTPLYAADASNTAGVHIPNRGVDRQVAIRVREAGTGTSGVFAVYGYVRSTRAQFKNSSLTAVNEWDFLGYLNGGTAITPTTLQSPGGVNVISPGANEYLYNAPYSIGSGYDRVLVLPVDLAGGSPSVTVDIGFAPES